MKGKWAQGIVPRNFTWVVKEQVAVCERPGGVGSNHRRVRRHGPYRAWRSSLLRSLGTGRGSWPSG